jgi:hypothetical protein
MRRLGCALLALTVIAVGWLHGSAVAQAPAAQPGTATANDTARFLAGLKPSEGSPLVALTSDPAWQAHAKSFDAQWLLLEQRQLSKVRAFQAKYLTEPQKTLFYMFSGPDFLYADAFFPKATIYVLSGLELIGPIPDPLKLRKGSLGQTLGHLKTSLRHIMGFSYFITLDMGKHLGQGQFRGTLPVLYVFLARTGKTIRGVQHMRLDPDGTLSEISETETDRPRVVKITFAGSDGTEQTLYYFNTNLANPGVAASGFLRFCEKLGTGDSFIKSASYLLHGGGFSSVRDFILANSMHVLQDDTGPPLTAFKADKWTLQPFGRYTMPISEFHNRYQTSLKTLFDRGAPPPFDFSVGYRWRPGQSNLLLATRK